MLCETCVITRTKRIHVLVETLFCPGSHQENMYIISIPPRTPVLYSKTGLYRGMPISLFFYIHNIGCEYSLKPPRRCGSNVYPQSIF